MGPAVPVAAAGEGAGLGRGPARDAASMAELAPGCFCELALVCQKARRCRIPAAAQGNTLPRASAARACPSRTFVHPFSLIAASKASASVASASVVFVPSSTSSQPLGFYLFHLEARALHEVQLRCRAESRAPGSPSG